MAQKKSGPLDWKSWQVEFHEAARKWERLVPGTTQVGVTDGTIYLVRGPARTKKELAALGWAYSAGGVRSQHPTPDKTSPLAKANRRLLTVCRRAPALGGDVDEELARQLSLAVRALIHQLDGQPDPATLQQRDAVRKVDDRVLDICRAAAHQRGLDVEAARKHEDERRQTRLLAEELQRLQRPNENPSTPAERAVQEVRARQQRVAETAFGRGALELLAATYKQNPGAWRQLAAFNGCGGQRWNKAASAKQRGKGYDHARRALAEMVRCDLVKRVGAGETQRGGFRITEQGLHVLATLRTN
jgi:hypothetical protein